MVTGISLRDVREDDLPIFYRHQLDPVATSMAVLPPRGFDAYGPLDQDLCRRHYRSKTIVFKTKWPGTLLLGARRHAKVGYWLERNSGAKELVRQHSANY